MQTRYIAFTWILYALALVSSGCELFLHSECEANPELPGCHVTLSISPESIDLYSDTELQVDFNEPGVADYVQESNLELDVELEQPGPEPLKLGTAHRAGNGVRVSVTRAQLQRLQPGSVTVRLNASNGASVSATARLRAPFFKIWSADNSQDRKWAGLRIGDKPHVVLVEKRPAPSIEGEFIEYTLQPGGPQSSWQPVEPRKTGVTAQLSRVPYASRSVYYGLDISQGLIRFMEKQTASVLAIPQAGSKSIYVDPKSDSVLLSTPTGLQLFTDLGQQAPTSRAVAPLSQVPNLVTAADLDRNGFLDVLVVDAPQTAHAYLQTSSGVFMPSTLRETNLTGSCADPAAIALAQLQRDLPMDLLVACPPRLHAIPVGSRSAPPRVLSPVSTENVLRLEVADVDADGLSDLAVVTTSGAALYLNTTEL